MTLPKIPSPYIICIYGPTGVGKTAFVRQLARKLPIEVINMDIGQMYQPLTIGTAKPDWRNEPVAHHMFDVFDCPHDYSVATYRADVQKLITQIVSRGNIPVLVGGSGFYLYNLLFPVNENITINHSSDDYKDKSTHELWQLLNDIDPVRAQQIHSNDRYRIQRGLLLWKATGKKPSEQVPEYNALMAMIVVELERDRTELYKQINSRVVQMLADGWQQEVEQLRGTKWETFVLRKGLIGYTELLQDQKEESSVIIESIAQQTRNYAKQQMSFGRMIAKKLDLCNATLHQKPTYFYRCNLTFAPLDLYLKQLIEWTHPNR